MKSGVQAASDEKNLQSLWTGKNFAVKIVVEMKRRFFLIFFALILITAGLTAQEREFSPYVSQIKAEHRNNLIRLTWVDSPDVRGPVYIFRSTRPFSDSVPPNIRPVIVRYGERSYIDETDDMENLYYFIAASDTSGQRYDIIIPQTNSTGTGIETADSPPPARVPPEPIQGISNLMTSVDGDKVIITFNAAGPRKNIVLYRSMQPVRQPHDLRNAIIVQSEIKSPFVDFPVPGISWYYAVIYEDEISGGRMEIVPEINATAAAVIISGGENMQRALRPIPLPVMTLRNAMPDGFFLSDTAEQIPMSERFTDMLKKSQMPPKTSLTMKKPRVFTVDLQSPSSGEESALFQIIKEFFEKHDWEGSRVSLLHYLSLPRSKDVEARARFYLGQTLYFTGNYREALFEFLSIRSIHPVEANIWIDAILTAMVN